MKLRLPRDSLPIASPSSRFLRATTNQATAMVTAVANAATACGTPITFAGVGFAPPTMVFALACR